MFLKVFDNYNYMRYEIDKDEFYIFELMYDNDYGTYWNIEENKDSFKEIKDFNILKNNTFSFIHNGNSYFESIDTLNNNIKIKYVNISAKEYIYGSNSKKLNKQLLYLKFRISPSIDDLLKNAQITYYSPLIHKNKLFANGFNNYQGILCIDNKIFRYLIRIGITNKEDSLFYDVSLYYLGNLKDKKGINIAVPSVNTSPLKIC